MSDVVMHIGGFDQFDKIDFDKSKVRSAFRRSGRIVQARAQMLLALGAGQAGYPVNRTGALLHAIKPRVSRSGFLVRIAPDMPEGAKEYYPAYLHYGVKRHAQRSKSHRKQATVGPWRIAPRDNYMSDALQDSAQQVQSVLFKALTKSLKPK